MVFENIFCLVTHLSYKRAFLIHFLFQCTCYKVFYDQDSVILSNISTGYCLTFHRKAKNIIVYVYTRFLKLIYFGYPRERIIFVRM